MAPINIPTAFRVWIRAGSVLAGAVIAIWLVVIPVVKWTGHQHVQIRELRIQLAEAQQFQQTAAAREQTLAQTRQQVQALQLQLSQGQGMAQIMDRLRADAERWHLEMNAAQSADHPAQSVSWRPQLSLQATPITLTVVGRYRAIGEFLGGLMRAPFVAEVERVSLKRHPERYPQLEANLTLLVYGTAASLAAP